MITRSKAETILKQVFGLEHFYDEQWNTIERLLRGERMLLIERTGFGKSLCYQFPAILFDGVTIIFSPLIALMRDQTNALKAKGIAARYINSEQAPEENTQAHHQLSEFIAQRYAGIGYYRNRYPTRTTGHRTTNRW